MSQNLFPELQHLLGLPLTKATRLGHVQYFHFGKAHIRNASGLILDVGAWTLEVACFWQLEEAGNASIQFKDVEVARDARTMADPEFDPLVPGSNLRDRKLHELIRQQESDVKVLQITASPEGDLGLVLSGSRILHILPGQGVVEGQPLYWRLFRNTEPLSSVGIGPEGITRQ